MAISVARASANSIASPWRNGQIGSTTRAARRASLQTGRPDDARGFFNGRGVSEAGQVLCHCWSSQKVQSGQEKKNGYPATSNVPYVTWFREAWPYIQGHRGSTFVIVIPGEVVENRSALESILQVRR